jgi:hypothetical protein
MMEVGCIGLLQTEGQQSLEATAVDESLSPDCPSRAITAKHSSFLGVLPMMS